MAEAKLFYDDVEIGDSAPEFSHELTRTDLVAFAGLLAALVALLCL